MKTRGKDLSLFDKGRIIGLHGTGKTTRETNEETGVGCRTIQRTMAYWKQYGEPQDHRFDKCLGSKELEGKMTALERDAWQSFRNVVHGFLRRNKADNYEDLVETLLQTYCKLGSRMSLKMQVVAKSMVNIFIKIFRWWRRGTKVDGMRPWWGIMSESWFEMTDEYTRGNAVQMSTFSYLVVYCV